MILPRHLLPFPLPLSLPFLPPASVQVKGPLDLPISDPPGLAISQHFHVLLHCFCLTLRKDGAIIWAPTGATAPPFPMPFWTHLPC